jgi:competence protein ComEC
LLAISIGRRATAGAALGLAVLILLIADPWLATDFGFALSASATAGILLLAPEIYLRLKTRLPNWLALGLSVTISAQLLCLPVLLQLQSGLSTYSVLANLLAEPLVAPVTILGILACLVAWFAPWLAFGLSWVASLATWWIALVAEQLAGLPMTTISWATGWLGATLAVVVIVATLLWLKAEPAGLKAAGALTLIAVLSITIGSSGASIAKSASWPPRDWLVVACDVGQGDALVVRSENQVAVIDVGKDRKLIDGCLTQLGIQRIDLLVLTHFDLDHIGGLAGALQGRAVGQALISPFKDDRWGASSSKQAIEQSGAVSSFGQVGVRGMLGEFSWRVLSPESNAAGAEDSNDASIIILWQGPQLNLLTMADLGERGQMRVAGSSDSWLGQGLNFVPMVLKVSHHGSADQYPELIEALGPDLALVSVGADNSYGHPTLRTIGLLEKLGTRIFRTDLSGDLSVSISDGVLGVSVSGHG